MRFVKKIYWLPLPNLDQNKEKKMKNIMKAMIVLGVMSFLVGMLASCRKSKEREILLRIGKPVEYWIYTLENSQVVKRNRFSVTVDRAFVTRTVPWKWPQRELESEVYLIAYACVENLGPREESPWCYPEVKTDSGSIYAVDCRVFTRIGTRVSRPFDVQRDWEPRFSSLKQGEKSWWAFSSKIPKDDTPVEIFGELGRFGGQDLPTKFRLRLPGDLTPSIGG